MTLGHLLEAIWFPFFLTHYVNSLILITKKQITNFHLQILKKMLSPVSFVILRIQRLEGKQCRLR